VDVAELDDLDRLTSRQIPQQMVVLPPVAQVGHGLVDDAAELRRPQDDGRAHASDNVGQDGRLTGPGDGLELADKGDILTGDSVGTGLVVIERGFHKLVGRDLLKVQQL